MSRWISFEGNRSVEFLGHLVRSCKVEMPAMERLYRIVSVARSLKFLAVSTDAQGAAVTPSFQQEAGFTFPVLHDADFASVSGMARDSSR